MTNPPEPLDVGPIAGGHLPVQERDKAQVASQLRTAAAEGRLTQPELDDRLHGVHVATSFDDLIPLTRDLVPDASQCWWSPADGQIYALAQGNVAVGGAGASAGAAASTAGSGGNTSGWAALSASSAWDALPATMESGNILPCWS